MYIIYIYRYKYLHIYNCVYIRICIYARYHMNFNVSFEVSTKNTQKIIKSPTLKVDFSIQLGRWICSRSILQAERNRQKPWDAVWVPGSRVPGTCSWDPSRWGARFAKRASLGLLQCNGKNHERPIWMKKYIGVPKFKKCLVHWAGGPLF